MSPVDDRTAETLQAEEGHGQIVFPGELAMRRGSDGLSGDSLSSIHMLEEAVLERLLLGFTEHTLLAPQYLLC